MRKDIHTEEYIYGEIYIQGNEDGHGEKREKTAIELDLELLYKAANCSKLLYKEADVRKSLP